MSMRRCVSKVVTIDCAGLQAANAGGVAVSGLEMSQNAVGLQWSREEVDSKLKVRARTLRMAAFTLSVCRRPRQHTLLHCNLLVHHAWPACCGGCQLCSLYTACDVSAPFVLHAPAVPMPAPPDADVCTPAAEQDIMKNIFKACKDASKEYNTTIQGGANIAGFLKVSSAQ